MMAVWSGYALLARALGLEPGFRRHICGTVATCVHDGAKPLEVNRMKQSAGTTNAETAEAAPVRTAPKPQAKAMPTRKAASVSDSDEAVEVTVESSRVEVEVEVETAKPEAPIDRRPPPRVPSEPQNYQEGDHVVYPTHGVGKVERIVTDRKSVV